MRNAEQKRQIDEADTQLVLDAVKNVFPKGVKVRVVDDVKSAIASAHEWRTQNAIFNSELEAFKAGKHKGALHLGVPGAILRASGLNATEITIEPKVLKEHLSKHGISIDDILNLPEALNNPLMVYEWGTKARSLIVITNFTLSDGRKITAAVKLERSGKSVEVNELSSVHGKSIERLLEEAVEKEPDFGKNKLKYVDKNKAVDWLGIAPPKGASAQSAQRLHLKEIIENFKNPSTEILEQQGMPDPFPLAPRSDFAKVDVGANIPVPFAGNKKTIIEAHPELFARIGELTQSLGGKVIDAFAGAGTYTVGLGTLGVLPKGSVLNEWAVSRYVMHKMLAKNPQGVVEAMRELVKRFSESEELKVFRQRLADIQSGKATKEKSTQVLVDWFNDELSGKHGIKYIDGNANNEFGDANLKENEQSAAFYMFLQTLMTGSHPVNFKFDGNGKLFIEVADGVFRTGHLSTRLINTKGGFNENALSPEKYIKRIEAAGKIYKEAGLDVRRGDGWALSKTANRGDAVFVDPAYLGVQAYGGKKGKTAQDANSKEETIAKLADLIKWAEVNGVSIVYTNEYSDKSGSKGLSQEEYAEVWKEALKRSGSETAGVNYFDREARGMGKAGEARADIVFVSGPASYLLKPSRTELDLLKEKHGFDTDEEAEAFAWQEKTKNLSAEEKAKAEEWRRIRYSAGAAFAPTPTAQRQWEKNRKAKMAKRDVLLAMITKKTGIKIIKESAEAIKRSAGKADGGRFKVTAEERSAAQKIYDLATQVFNGTKKDNTGRVSFAPSERLKAKLKELLGEDVNELFITVSDMRHIKDGHANGNEESRGQVEMKPEDVACIPYLLNNFDEANLSPRHYDKKGNKAVTIKTRINGVYIVCTIERGEFVGGKHKHQVRSAWCFAPTKKAADALDAKNNKYSPPGLDVRNDSADKLNEVKKDIAEIKANLLGGDAEVQRIEAEARANGTWLKAPNGKPSKLNARQWVQVRTAAFKAWFGDWENDAANASKVVDENGEPLVIYSGTRDANHTSFTDKMNKPGDKGVMWGSNQRGVASSYAGTDAEASWETVDDGAESTLESEEADEYDQAAGYSGEIQPGVYSVFLNIRNPKHVDANGRRWNEIQTGGKQKKSVEFSMLPDDVAERVAREMASDTGVEVELDENGDWVNFEECADAIEEYYREYNAETDDDGNIVKYGETPKFYENGDIAEVVPATETTRDIANRELGNGNDGIVFYNIEDKGRFGVNFGQGVFNIGTNVYVVPSSEQIKSATENVGTFDGGNADIRYLEYQGTIYGYFDPVRRELHLNEDFADFDTPIHEWTHVWWAWLKEQDPRLIGRIVELMKQTKEFKAFRMAVMTDKSSVYNGLSNEELAQEVFARFIGKRGEDIMAQEGLGTWAKIRRYALDFFKGVMRTLGLSQEEVDSLTFEDVQNMCLRDLFDNETLGIKGLRLKINQRSALMDAIDNAAMDWSIDDGNAFFGSLYDRDIAKEQKTGKPELKNPATMFQRGGNARQIDEADTQLVLDAVKNVFPKGVNVRVVDDVEAAVASGREWRTRNAIFNSELEAFKAGTHKGVLHLGVPGAILRASGLNTTEITIEPKVLKEHLSKHGISIDDILNLPEALNNPLMVYEWGTKARSLIVITDFTLSDGRKITAAVKLERSGKRVEVNELSSVHGKTAERFLGDMSKASRGGLKEALRYIPDKQKALEWLGLVPPKGTAAQSAQELHLKGIKENFKNPSTEILEQRAFHGSPHNFSAEENAPLGRFRDDKMGSGEGAQAFGWGHYLTSEEKIARKEYAERLAKLLYGAPDGDTKEEANERAEEKAKEIIEEWSGEKGLKEFGYDSEEYGTVEICDKYLEYGLYESTIDDLYDEIQSSNLSDEIKRKVEALKEYYDSTEDEFSGEDLSEEELGELEDYFRGKREDAIERWDEWVRIEPVARVHDDDDGTVYVLSHDGETLYKFEYFIEEDGEKRRHLYTAEFDDSALLDWTKPLTEEQEDRIAAELAKTDPELAERIFASSEEIAAAKKAYEEADAEFYKAVEAYQNEENTGTSLIPSENVVAARERMHKADNKAKEAKLRLDWVKKLRGSKLSSIHEAMRSPNEAKTLSKAFFRAGFVGHKFPAASMGIGNYSKGTNYVIYDESALQIVDKVSWLKNARGKVFGAYNSATKEVFIAKNARIDTVLHELGWHAMFDWASSNAPEFHAKMREYAANAPEAIKAQVRKAYPDLNEQSEAFLDEVGAHAFSLDHYGKIEDLLKTAKDKTWWGNVKRLFKKIWKAFSKALGKDRVDLSALSKMDYKDAIAQWAEDFVNGKRLQSPVDGSGTGNGGMREQFIGERGAAEMDAATDPLTWELLGTQSRMQNLNIAREMEAAGKSRAEILYATGWYRGKDKKWRREIGDGKLRDDYIGMASTPLKYLYDAPELYKAYPELKDIQVHFEEISANAEVRFNGDAWEIAIRRGLPKELISKSLVHEVQHLIQVKEGFSRGGNPDMHNPDVIATLGRRIEDAKNSIAELRKEVAKIEKEEIDPINEKMSAWWESHGEEADPNTDADFRKLNEAYDSATEKRDALLEAISDLEKSIDDNAAKIRGNFSSLGMSGYRRLAGEVEARNVSRRLDDKRMSPWNTEDVAEEEQIVLRNLLDSAESRIAEDSSEVARIEAESKANGTWLKAPNGKPTKLNPRQWVQVRTKAFKKWFGDWEKAARIEKLKNSVPVEISGNEIEASEDFKTYRKNAKNYGASIRGSYTNKDTGETISVSMGGINEVVSHDSSVEQFQSVAAIPRMIEDSIFIETLSNEDKAKHPDVSHYSYYVCGLKIGGVDYTAKIVVALQKNGERYYDHKLTQIEKGALLSTISAIHKAGEESTTPFADIKDKRLLSILQVDSSKVVDENGEPRVVYHQTGNDFWTFDMSKARQNMDLPAAYFSSGTEDWADFGGRVIPAFLNIRNPKIGKPAAKGNGRAVRDALVRDGFDGTIEHEDGIETEYAAFSPEQIKSATDNAGTFDAGNPDIRFQREEPEEVSPADQQFEAEKAAGVKYLHWTAKKRIQQGAMALAWKLMTLGRQMPNLDDVRAIYPYETNGFVLRETRNVAKAYMEIIKARGKDISKMSLVEAEPVLVAAHTVTPTNTL